jgi:acetyl-CoA carboxylase biotin carboxylase subunit
VHAPDRPAAIAAARRALAALRIEGVKTTIPLHARILEDEEFVRGTYDLALLSRRRLVMPAAAGG